MRRVLVADDDELVAELVRTVLSPDYEVKCAGDGVTALDLVRSWDPDVALIDLSLPRLSGVEVAQTVRAWRSGHRPWLLAFSGSLVPDGPGVTGFDGIVSKPVSPGELRRAIAALTDVTPV